MTSRQSKKNDVAGPKAVVLLSGGIDSYTTAGIACKKEGFNLYALTVEYGQRHACEVQAARQIAVDLGVIEHKEISLDLRLFGGSALTDEIAVPKGGCKTSDADGQEIPATYVPARNTIMLSLALGWAEVVGAFDLFIGVNAVDYSGYPDCRPEYIAAFEKMANLATKAGATGQGLYRIHTPLIMLSKEQIIKVGLELELDYGLSHSCYDPDPQGRACGCCDSCIIRMKAFADAGIKDPVTYAAK